MRDSQKATLALLLIIAAALLIYGFDYCIWKLEHPQAPRWTYLIRD